MYKQKTKDMAYLKQVIYVNDDMKEKTYNTKDNGDITVYTLDQSYNPKQLTKVMQDKMKEIQGNRSPTNTGLNTANSDMLKAYEKFKVLLRYEENAIKEMTILEGDIASLNAPTVGTHKQAETIQKTVDNIHQKLADIKINYISSEINQEPEYQALVEHMEKKR